MVSSVQSTPLTPARTSISKEPINSSVDKGKGSTLKGNGSKVPDIQIEEVEALPPYTSSITLTSLCLRKREFTTAYEKTRRGKRTWELVWLMLDGTALRIYRPTEKERRSFEEERLGGSVYSATSVEPSTGAATTGGGSRPPSFSSIPGQPIQLPTRLPPTARLTPNLPLRQPIRQYHLRHSVCMKADSYFKRDHVLRFILENGKQFLIQLGSWKESVAWLQSMAVAAPLALDLDERPMPDPAQYPRFPRRVRPRSALPPTSLSPPPIEESPISAIASTPDLSITSTPPLTETTPSLSDQPSTSNDHHESNPRLTSTSLACLPTVLSTEEEDEDESELEMDHLPPPRRPLLLHSLSSVEQARRLGIQL